MTTIRTTASRLLSRRILLAALAVVGVTAQAQTAAPAQQTFEVAMQAYEDGHYAAAYGRFVRLADGGDAEAARIALAMHRHGLQLYGSQWGAEPQQLRAWLAAASGAGAATVATVKR
jgi:hypothetical protein